MLFSQQGHNASQMQDVIVSHIVPRLRLSDVQSLGQTSQQLRALVHTGLPPASWLQSAVLSLPPGHPLLINPPQSMTRELTRLADLHAAIVQGRLAAVSELTFSQGLAEAPTSLAVSPSGRLTIAKQDGMLVLSRLAQSRSQGKLDAHDIWTLAAPAPPPPWG